MKPRSFFFFLIFFSAMWCYFDTMRVKIYITIKVCESALVLHTKQQDCGA